METKGIEQPALTTSKTQILQKLSAKSGALHDDFFQKYPDFRDIIERSNLAIKFKKDLVDVLKQGGEK